MSVVSIIVTYNPDGDFNSRLQKIAEQSDFTVIVDNRSDISVEKYLVGVKNTTLIRNTENLGIATAINQGVHYAYAYGADFACLFDQDSEIVDGFIQTLLHGFSTVVNTGIVAANYISPVSGRLGYEHGNAISEEFIQIDHSITSGSMLKISIIRKIGFMKDDLFIDYVDVEFSERLHDSYLVLATRESMMVHPIGNAEMHNLFGRAVAASNHSPLRVYYMSRNCMNLFAYNIFLNSKFSYISFLRLVKLSIVILLLEREKTKKFRAILLGIIDGLSNKMGKTRHSF